MPNIDRPTTTRTEKRIHPSFGCPHCLAIFDWNLLGACASVGIEFGKSTQQMASEFMLAYHLTGHARRQSPSSAETGANSAKKAVN